MDNRQNLTNINWAVGIYGQPLPRLDKIRDLVNKVFTYYVFKVDGKLVKIGFTDNGKSAEECLMNVIDSLYR